MALSPLFLEPFGFSFSHRLTWPVLALLLLLHHHHPNPPRPLIYPSHLHLSSLISSLLFFFVGYQFGIPTVRARVVQVAMEVSRCKEMSGEKLRRRRRRSVRRKVKKLQRLIPGGRGLQPDRLFLRTADYILHLRLQVNVLQALSKIYKPWV